MLEEPNTVTEFRTWLASHGAHFNPKVRYASVISGLSVVAGEPLEADSTIVSCPISLAITPSLSKAALVQILPDATVLDGWNERQLISVYITFHWILLVNPESNKALAHLPYLRTLPSPSQLRTPLHFTTAELDALKGTNLYGATLDRRCDWKAEWEQCRAGLSKVNIEWSEGLTWDRYLSAATYLSSRAFPSTLLSRTPSLLVSATSYPVLLPGIDSLNHARAQPVSWVVTFPRPARDEQDTPAAVSEPTISLVSHAVLPAQAEIFNNYGPKPNSELILGYGFAIQENPDDTIVLKIGGVGGGSGQRWEVGRQAKGMEGLWKEILAAVSTPQESNDQDDMDVRSEWSLILDAADMLKSMSGALLSRLPGPIIGGSARPDVAMMIEHYVSGQRDILLAIMDFADKREIEAVKLARSEGHAVVLEDDLMEEDEDEG